MVSFTYTTVVAISVLSLVAPSLQASMAIKAGASLLGGVLSGGHKQSRAVGHQAPLDAATLQSIEGPFKKCFAVLEKDPNHKLAMHKETKDARISNLPSVCIASAKEVLALPNIAAIEKSQGAFKIVGADTIEFTGVGPLVDELMKSDNTAGAKGAKGAKGAAGAAGAKGAEKKPAGAKAAGAAHV